jgi:hypothetical protein
MTRQAGLDAQATISLSAAGGGTAQLGPVNPGEVWNVDVVSVSCATNVSEAECQVYVGDTATQNNYVDGTLSGSTGDSTDRVTRPVYPGQYVFAVWSGGDVGTTAIIRVQGSRSVP